MKNLSAFIIGLSVIFVCNWATGKPTTDNQPVNVPSSPVENSLTILSSPELNNLAKTWTSEYERLYPSLQIKVEAYNEEFNQPLNAKAIGLIIDATKTGQSKDAWKMVVGHDAVVPVISAKNPLLNEINRQGLTSEDFAMLFTGKTSWNKLIDVQANAVANCFFINNESIKENFAKYSNTDFEAVKINTVTSATEMISALSKDVYAIGFCRLTDISNSETGSLSENIKFLPIDKNQNGRMDYFEKIYDNLNTFTRGIWIGKYPNELSGNVYAIAASKPTDENTLAFLSWMLADGQKYLNKNGYSFLASNEIQSNRDELQATGELATATVSEVPLMAKTWPFLAIILIVVALGVFGVYRYARKNNSAILDEDLSLTPAFDENSIIAPKGLYFDKTHTWAFMESNGMVKIGLDDFMQHITGNITRIKLKESGESVRKGEKIVTIIRDGKQLDIYSPISGTIINYNQELKTSPALINSATFSEGWIYSIEPKNWLREIQFLFMGETYQDWLKDEFTRLKDFFATYMRSSQAVYSHIVLQDGGALTDNILADMEPEVWEEFQNKFLNTSK
jgi:glycine cleavage system H lipoate-binding protein/ABC-type phosphate transport system substrate-binding protein